MRTPIARTFDQMFTRFRTQYCNSLKRPSGPNQKLAEASNEKADKIVHVPYQVVVDSILYLAHCSRPDVSLAIGHASKFNRNPGLAYWNAA